MNGEPLGIDVDRSLHMLQVGRTSYRLSKDLFSWDDSKCRQMFVLGLIHDCGYEFAFEQTDHPSIGADILEECGFSYSEEIRWHGMASAPYSSDELLVLNIADLITSKDGKVITTVKRSEDIARRYGVDSPQYDEVIALISEISAKLKGLRFHSNLLDDNWISLT